MGRGSSFGEVHIPLMPTTNLLLKIFSDTAILVHWYPILHLLLSVMSSNTTALTIDSIIKKFIAPGPPATNGLDERNVQIVMKRLKSMENETGAMTDKMRRMLLPYRTTPLARGTSPLEIYLHRRLRIELDLKIPFPKK